MLRDHLRLEGRERALPYTYAGRVRSKERRIPERDRQQHAQRLQGQLQGAAEAIGESAGEANADGFPLEFRGEPGFELAFESLEDRRAGIVLNNVRREGELTVATVWVPAGKLGVFVDKLEKYAHEDTPKKGTPRHQKLVASIAEIRPAVLRSFWTDRAERFPADSAAQVWWEVWLRRPAQEAAKAVVEQFTAHATNQGMAVKSEFIAFPERVVVLAWGSVDQWTGSLPLMNMLAELRQAKEPVTPLLDFAPRDQKAFADDARQRLTPPPADAPAVCLLDTGVAYTHLLIEPALAAGDALTVHPAWGNHDHDGHGTRMAGIALYGSELAEFVAGNPSLVLRHRLESVKLLPPTGQNEPELYGSLTQDAVAEAETQNPNRRRIACMAVTAEEREDGSPTSWSAAIDEHSAGRLDDHRRLYVVAAGNLDVVNDAAYSYPDSNHSGGIQDPAHAWNALTVGAMTERVVVGVPDYDPIARRGGLCPSSRTSRPWDDTSWPYKPDVCAEGGNYAVNELGWRDCLEELQLLTTAATREGRLFGLMKDTSAAAAQVARMAAMVQARYSDLWPETVRALLVHAARWTPEMERACPATNKTMQQYRLRCFGYGVPDLDRALHSLDNRATLVYEGALRPFRKVPGKSRISTADYHLHELPWPREVLQQLAGLEVTVRVTLSYFIEPSPGNRGWSNTHRYQSHGLRFEMRKPGQTEADFQKKISKLAALEDDPGPGTAGEAVDWVLGPKSRVRGSIHSDWWTGTAAAVADAGQLAVYPVRGWWADRPHLERYDREARYSLVITLETAEASVNLYTPIANALQVPVEVSV